MCSQRRSAVCSLGGSARSLVNNDVRVTNELWRFDLTSQGSTRVDGAWTLLQVGGRGPSSRGKDRDRRRRASSGADAAAADAPPAAGGGGAAAADDDDEPWVPEASRSVRVKVYAYDAAGDDAYVDMAVAPGAKVVLALTDAEVERHLEAPLVPLRPPARAR